MFRSASTALDLIVTGTIVGRSTSLLTTRPEAGSYMLGFAVSVSLLMYAASSVTAPCLRNRSHANLFSDVSTAIASIASSPPDLRRATMVSPMPAASAIMTLARCERSASTTIEPAARSRISRIDEVINTLRICTVSYVPWSIQRGDLSSWDVEDFGPSLPKRFSVRRSSSPFFGSLAVSGNPFFSSFSLNLIRSSSAFCSSLIACN